MRRTAKFLISLAATVLAGAMLAILSLVFGLPMLLFARFTGVVGPFYGSMVFALRMALAVGGVRVRVEGAGNIPSGPCLFMPNHTSAIDPVAVFVSLPRRIAFLAKRELFAIPLFGWGMRMAGFIPVDRASRGAAAASARRAVERLRGGASMVIYPEGTRSPDGCLLPFKHGGFLTAIRGGCPVVPITVTGAERVLPKGAVRIRPGVIRLLVHAHVDVSGYGERDRNRLLERVRAAIAGALPEELRG